jgi:hypothetical protein
MKESLMKPLDTAVKCGKNSHGYALVEKECSKCEYCIEIRIPWYIYLVKCSHPNGVNDFPRL